MKAHCFLRCTFLLGCDAPSAPLCRRHLQACTKQKKADGLKTALGIMERIISRPDDIAARRLRVTHTVLKVRPVLLINCPCYTASSLLVLLVFGICPGRGFAGEANRTNWRHRAALRNGVPSAPTEHRKRRHAGEQNRSLCTHKHASWRSRNTGRKGIPPLWPDSRWRIFPISQVGGGYISLPRALNAVGIAP